jgi:flavin-dependent dehydrogenase
MDVDADVIVIGGGPAGSTAATMLAQRERAPLRTWPFPGYIGESFCASIPILESSARCRHPGGFHSKWGATMVWGVQSRGMVLRETNKPTSVPVWRPQFDQILLENSRRSGVDVREGHRVREVLFDGETAVGVGVGDGAREWPVRSRFVVDASGQEGVLGRARGLRKPDDQFRNLAIFAYFTDADRLPEPDETNIFIESYSEGWSWVIPLHTGSTSVGFVMDSKVAQKAVRSDGLEATYVRQIGLAPHTGRMLRGAVRVAGPTIIRDWSYVSEDIAGDGYVIAGDAACFIDPLFSTGVHLALSAGVLAAAYVTSSLKDPAMRESAARVYANLYYNQYNLFRELARLFYAGNRSTDSYFWEARRIIGAGESASPREAFVRAAAGQPPQGYERIVLEHGHPPGEFVEGVRRIEDERAERGRRMEAIPAAERATRLLGAVPVLAEGIRVEQQPVLGEGEFVWGNVITAHGRSITCP